jgi:hypothetical protein
MFSVSAISNSYLNKILLYKRNSSEDSNTLAQVSDLEASDIVTLSSESLEFLEGLINSSGDASSTGVSVDSSAILDGIYNNTEEETESSASSNVSLDLLNVLFNSTVNAPDTSDDSLYNVLLSAQNEKLIKNNPDLVNMILSAEETDSSEGASWVPATEDTDLVSLSANEILNIIKKYKTYSGSADAPASLIDTTA